MLQEILGRPDRQRIAFIEKSAPQACQEANDLRLLWRHLLKSRDIVFLKLPLYKDAISPGSKAGANNALSTIHLKSKAFVYHNHVYLPSFCRNFESINLHPTKAICIFGLYWRGERHREEYAISFPGSVFPSSIQSP